MIPREWLAYRITQENLVIYAFLTKYALFFPEYCKTVRKKYQSVQSFCSVCIRKHHGHTCKTNLYQAAVNKGRGEGGDSKRWVANLTRFSCPPFSSSALAQIFAAPWNCTKERLQDFPAGFLCIGSK